MNNSKAEEYLVKGEGRYEFPFILIDPTPNGNSLGRISWQIEPIFKRGKMVKIFLQARQTRDERYADTLFELEVNSPCAFGSPLDQDDFLGKIWRLGYCTQHKTVTLEAHPEDGHSILSIERYSGIGIRIEFK